MATHNNAAQSYNVKTFLWQAISQPGISLQVLLGSLTINLLGLGVPLFTMLVFSRYLTHGLDATLFTLCSGVLIVLSLEYNLKRIRFKLLSSFTLKRDRLLAEQVHDQLLKAKFENLTQGLRALRPGMAERHLERVSSGMSVNILQSFLDAPFTIIFVMTLFFLAWPLALCVLVVLSMLIVFSLLRNRKSKLDAQEMQKTRVQTMGAFGAAQRFEATRMTNAVSYMDKVFEGLSNKFRCVKHGMDNASDKAQSLIYLCTLLTSVLVISVGAKLVVSGHLDFSGLIGANLLAARCIALFTRPLQQLVQFEQARQSMNTLQNFLKIPKEQEEGVKLPEFTATLELSDLSYRYTGQQTGPLFEHLSLTLKAGETLVVQGANGSGKTTLARLLTGLLSPVRGQILYDGVDLRQLDLFWWRQQLVYLPQEPSFLEASLKQNFLIYNPNLEEDEMMNLMSLVGLQQFIQTHPDGMEMPIVDNGRALSMGIKRRIALARAMVCSGKLVILDEPIIGVDGQGRQAIQGIMQQLHKEGRTMIIFNSGDGVPQFTDYILNLNQKPTPSLQPFKPQRQVRAHG